MDSKQVAPALRERLGHEATVGLLDLLGEAKKEWLAEVITVAGDRFERRLVEETSKLRTETSNLRVDMARGFAALRQEMTAGFAAARQETATLRQDMVAEFGRMRQEMAAEFAAVRQEMSTQHFETLKWVFLFWVGQFFAVGSLMAIFFRFLKLD